MSNASAIAADLIDQLAQQYWSIPYSIAYRRMYINALEDLPAAGTPDSKLKITLAPIEYEPERTGWGGARVNCGLGIICEKMVEDPNNDAEIDPLETFVESLAAWLIGPRKYAGDVWNAEKPKAIFGDDYIGELYENNRFFVPILVNFFTDGTVS